MMFRRRQPGTSPGNRQSTRNRISEEEKAEKLPKIIEGRAKGTTNFHLAKELGLNWVTIEKWYKEYLADIGETEDPAHTLKREVGRISYALEKCTRDYHAGKNKATDFVAMSAHYLKYARIDRYIDSITPQLPPALLDITVKLAEVELPPTLVQED